MVGEYYSTRKVEAKVSREIVVKLKHNTRPHVPEGISTEILNLESNM
jgi:hypothetical protein